MSMPVLPLVIFFSHLCWWLLLFPASSCWCHTLPGLLVPRGPLHCQIFEPLTPLLTASCLHD